jgi:DNA repair protein RadA/Sms
MSGLHVRMVRSSDDRGRPVAKLAPKQKTVFACGECGHASPKWLGQCPACKRWNTLNEELPPPEERGAPRVFGGVARAARPVPLHEVEASEDARLRTGIGELDRVLGGGVVPGSLVLLGGDPGIGKSTLLLTALERLAAVVAGRPILYVTGEESARQVKLRADRLGVTAATLHLYPETDAGKVLHAAEQLRPAVLAIDSIQTQYLPELVSAPGTVTQIRETAARFMAFAKITDTPTFLVGHVTKDGAIAGPRVLEHMVDTVLYFEGETHTSFRLIRAFKNRFGAVNELGVFAMGDKGLREVPNPSAIFLSAHTQPTAGSAVMVTREGTRPLLVEVQALVDQSSLGNPRRVALGLEQNRLAMLLAVLHRHGGAAVYDQDVFVNVVGGIRVQETAADLPVLLAVLSSFRDRPLPDKTVAFGEVGLSGEIRPVPNGEERLKEAATHGFKRAIVPKANAPKKARIGEMEIIAVDRLAEAIEATRRE